MASCTTRQTDLHKEDIIVLGGVNHLQHLLAVHCQWFLTQNMFLVIHAETGHLTVRCVNGAHIHDV